MSDLINIIGITANGFHGVIPKERSDGQKFIVDAQLKVNLKNLKDNLEKTVNYAAVAELINEHIVGDPVLLIETLAENIAKSILKEFKRVRQVTITVHKPQAPIPVAFGDVSVQIVRKR